MTSFIAVFTISIFVVTFSLTLGTTSWVYATEILTEKGMGIAIFCHFLFNFLINYLPDLVLTIENRDSEYYYDRDIAVSFFLFSGMCIIAFFVLTVFLKETKNKSRSQVKHLYDNKLFDTLTKNSFLN